MGRAFALAFGAVLGAFTALAVVATGPALIVGWVLR